MFGENLQGSAQDVGITNKIEGSLDLLNSKEFK
jgi:hypothetical protein